MVEVEKDGCGVGFLVSLKNARTHDTLKQGLHALNCMEHRGGVGPDEIGDGAGIMTSIPYELFKREPGTFAVANLLIPKDPVKRAMSIKVFEETFWQFGLKIIDYREVPINTTVLSKHSLKIMPGLLQAVIARPDHCRTLYSFERLLYMARQMTRTKEKEHGIHQEFYFNSLSPRNIIYKALCRSQDLKEFYRDLQNEEYKTNFALFHRRFSTNTISTWDKIQPFRLIAHNGEINTIEGNKAWAITREIALGLKRDELITHEGISDSGNLNGIAEGLRYRSSIPKLAEVMAILMPPAIHDSNYYKFWGRGMEPWDGPAMVAYSDGKYIGARLDRNGFRPCRWFKTSEHFYLSSEAGVFSINYEDIERKGALSSGESVTINVLSGQISFLDPKDFPENKNAAFDPQSFHLSKFPIAEIEDDILTQQKLFGFSKEEVDKLIVPMTSDSKEPLGSMGDTACLPFLSDRPRSLYDFFYQDFAQVTNPPIDYIRERIVTDMRVYLGRKPNIFEPKEFIPLKPTIELDGPVLSLGQLKHLLTLNENPEYPDLRSFRIGLTFNKDLDLGGFMARLDEIQEEAINALKKGFSLLILSDRDADEINLPIPSLLALAHLNRGLNYTGRRLRTSLIMDVGDARNAHQIACLLGHGASAVCPHLGIKTGLLSEDPKLANLFLEEREKRYIKALTEGVLRIMSKRGISVFRSYQGSKLFTPIGLGQDVLDKFFKGKSSVIGGYSLQRLFDLIKSNSASPEGELTPSFLFKEHAAGKLGEGHTMTSKRARFIHKMVESENIDDAYKQFKSLGVELDERPLLIRHLLRPKTISNPVANTAPLTEILASFGSGAMSFGAISAEAQRDLILAFREIGGRSNSGEGGENPYYESDGVTSTIKQIASGRFGVTAEYLVNGKEVQIKIAQGAKPGEGGQLMGVKVTPEIAKARFTSPGVDLISPAPQHDIYSIEDLKQLIYELKQLGPELKVSVKLVSGDNIGAIAVGVVKAGADIIQISGGDGGTGAASILSMKHAGLPLEIGLLEVHRALMQNGMRDRVILRADGGFITGKDIIIAALLGAEEFDFGKLLLVSEGCIMARICEKNTCPVGIATHDPKFKAHYKGNQQKVVKLLQCLAMEVRDILGEMGFTALKEITGKNHLLETNERHAEVIGNRGLNLGHFTKDYGASFSAGTFPTDCTSDLNQKIIQNIDSKKSFDVRNVDRAIPATLSGLYALKTPGLPEKVKLEFKGSAGQGFGVFNVMNIDIRLEGEANDSVGKGMSGGLIVITPPDNTSPEYVSERNTIIGNCTLYGATGGTLFVHGRAGDRFAVRNSGAMAVVEGVGLHACEYMSGGLIWILGEAKANIGAGMSGGVIYLPKDLHRHINTEYVTEVPLKSEDCKTLMQLGEHYLRETRSGSMRQILAENSIKRRFVKLIPKIKV
ncbi:MAG TPA: glutamate synthase large subunit [Bacteriovoracaceae bacterium]|nr:glutamate synthase large subunit [Bacteriovoracaceae bacterium]